MIIAKTRSLCLVVLAFAMLPSSARAQTTALAPGLAPIAFLLGSWTSDDGTVADTGEHARGRSEITAEAGGAAILRRDHTDLSTAAGKATESFDQIMLI